MASPRGARLTRLRPNVDRLRGRLISSHTLRARIPVGLSWFLSVPALLVSAPALAQYGQPPGGGFGGGEQPKDTPEGPAEQAPEKEGAEAELTPPHWPGEEQVEIKFLEVHGYFRFRGLLFHNPTLGVLHDGGSYVTGAPRPNFYPGMPLSETPDANGDTVLACSDREADGADVDCPANTLGGGNMRFRLEPTINVTEEVRIKSQLDVFDNLVLGSTPEGWYLDKEAADGYTPIVAFSGGQAPPEAGRNWNQAAIRVKRAWGEVRTPLGELRFGRMPSNWGMGILANNGDCLDCDYGDNADRLLFATRLFDHLFVLGHDWAATGPTTATSSQAGLLRGGGQPIDLEQLDDVGQFFFVIGRIDKPVELQERMDRGDTVVNYGSYFVWRRQAFDWAYSGAQSLGDPPNPDRFVERGAWAIIPDAWFRLSMRKLEVEFEGAYIHGEIESLDDVTNVGVPSGVSGFHVRQWGFAQRTTYKALRNTLRVGIEVGGASGDEAETHNINVLGGGSNPPPACDIDSGCPAGSDTFSLFRFDPDYKVDLVLFREILGMVQNALYVRSFLAYDPVETFRLQMALVPSWALEPVSTPGNKSWYGMELDTGIFWNNEEHGFHAGLEWGVFFSAGAFNSVDGTTPSWDGGIAQALRGILAITY